jgi:hypothetical protein
MCEKENKRESKKMTAIVCFLLPLCSANSPPKTSFLMMAFAA